jgi:hypothetical protein
MKNRNMVAMVLGMLISPVIPAGRDVQTCTNICGGNNVYCKQKQSCHGSTGNSGAFGLNSVGQKFYWNTTGTQRVNFGRISSTQSFSLRIPEVGSKMIYSFTPTQGSLPGKKIDMLFVAVDAAHKDFAGLPKNLVKQIKEAMNFPNLADAKTVVYVYGQIQGSKEWTEITHAFIDKETTAGLDPVRATLAPNSDITIKGFPHMQLDGTYKQMDDWTINAVTFLL